MPLMPLMLLGLLGISIPVIIHLLHRQQTQPIAWGAMQFLRHSPRQMKRRKKLDHWLLMAMRMLAVGLLALVLSRPRLPQSDWIPKQWTDAPIDVAVIVDHSLSTGRMSGGQTVFDRSVALTGKLLDQLKPSDTISIVLAEHAPRAMNTQPMNNSDTTAANQLRRQLGKLPQGVTDCSIPDAISTARRLLAAGRNANKEILILSDQQRVNWHIRDAALWRAAVGDSSPARPFTIHSLPFSTDADFTNVSVSAPAIQPTILGTNRPVQITAQITNTGTQPMNGLVARLLVNGKETDTKPITPLSPKSSATIRFDIDQGFAAPGSNTVQVAVNATDALQADNQAVAAANVLQHIPVLIIDGQYSDAGGFKSSQFLQAALQPEDPSLVETTVISVTQAVTAKLDEYAVVVVNDAPLLPQELCDRLADFTRTGHGLWIIFGPRTQQSTIDKDLAALVAAPVRELVNSTAAPSGLEVKSPNHPVIRIVTENQQNALTGVVTRQWWALKPTDAPVILAADNGDPLVIERSFGTNGGLVDIWTSSVDGSWNNWNLMPNFVPLVNETVYHLAAPSLHGLENQGLEAGQPIEWAGAAKPAVESIHITLPDNTTVTRPATLNHGRWLLTDPDTSLPGIYTLTFTPPQIPPVHFAVNIDHTQLDATPLDTDDIAWLKAGSYLDPALPVITERELPRIIRRKGQPPELWGLLAGVLLFSLLIETFLSYRLIKAQKKVDAP